MPDEPPRRRILPALPQDELLSEALLAETTAATRPPLPVEMVLPVTPALMPGDAAMAAAESPSDHPVRNEAARSDRPDAPTVPSPIEQIDPDRRVAAALARAEKGKRRLAALLRSGREP